ncbi:uncharacterized protein LOC120213976 [Hibiscus syriacus]|uniref:uncharacterized protein LOC120213976 n=1 Tax=Hibiscus syriacus TaxID=106335 RepID=UPI0019231F1D|nr:uncharacterized protein LOC120213976 [Hibiscus syriacus]
MQKEALVILFYNLSSSSLLLLLFLYSSSILLVNFFSFVGSYPLIPRTRNGFDYGMFSEEEEEENGVEKYNYKVNFTENDHLVADIIHGGESLVFRHDNGFRKTRNRVDAMITMKKTMISSSRMKIKNIM